MLLKHTVLPLQLLVFCVFFPGYWFRFPRVETFSPFLPPCSILPSKLVPILAFCVQPVPGTLSNSQPVPVSLLTSHLTRILDSVDSFPFLSFCFCFFFSLTFCVFIRKILPKFSRERRKGATKLNRKLLHLGAAITSLAKFHLCSSRPNSMCLIKVHVNT